MKKRLYITSMAVAMILASCQKSEELITEIEGSSEVVFTSAISTRAVGTEWEDGDKIGVFMYGAGESDIYDSSSENVLYTTSDGESGTFTSDNPLLFEGEVDVDFIAYYPYNNAMEGVAAEVNTVDQSTQENINALDFMVASATECNYMVSPTLDFSRKMSKFVINVSLEGLKADAVISNITFESLATHATFTLDNSDTGREKGLMVASETNANISMFFNQTSSKIEAIIVPQTVTNSVVNLEIDDESYYAQISETFVEGYQYSYNLTISGVGVEFSTGSTTSWDEEADQSNLYLSNLEFTASEIDADNTPSSDTWTITDGEEITYELMEGVRAALEVAKSEGRSIKIILPNATLIGINAFDFAEGDQSYYDGISALTEIEMPNVTYISGYAFRYCGFTSFDFAGIEYIYDGAFSGCANLTEITNFNFTSIPTSLFNGCGFTSFDFDGITEVGVDAFNNCANLTEITNYNLTTISDGLFNGCGFTSFDFTNITSIGMVAFVSCENLTEIELPSSVTSIGYYAFYDTGITTLTLNWTGEDILTYSSDWFVNYDYELEEIIYCPLKTIYIPEGTKYNYVEKNWPEELIVSY